MSSDASVRANAVLGLADAGLASGHLTPEQHSAYLTLLDDIQGSASHASKLSAVGALISQDIGLSSGIGDPGSASATMSSALARAVLEDHTSASIPDFDRLAGDVSSIMDGLSGYAGVLPDNLSGLGPDIQSSMTSSLNSVLVGVGGGFIGDTAEFLNLSYDAIKAGVTTGDWSSFHTAVANYGVSAVLSAAIIAGTTALTAAALGPAAAALVGAAWAGYGLYDGIVNIAGLLSKIAADLGFDPGGGGDPGLLASLLGSFLSPPISPLVVDLDGDGVELIALSEPLAQFDLNVDGFAERTGWVAEDDGLLAFDRNGNGDIDNNLELFGTGAGHDNGFLHLAELDTNSDGRITTADEAFALLSIWRDADEDGRTDAGEVQPLSAYGIVSIDLNAQEVGGTNNGHIVSHRSSVGFTDGTNRTVDDIFFEADQRITQKRLPDGFVYNFEALALPALFGYGKLESSWVALSENSTLRAMAMNLVALLDQGDVVGFGNDTVRGAGESDTYRYALGDGNDFLYDFGSSADANRLVLAGIDPGDVTVTRSTSDLDDLTLSFAGGGSVFLSEHFYSGMYGIDYIDFADGTSWDRAYLRARHLADHSTPGNDVIDGFDNANDVITGGLGNDTVRGAGESDTYRYALGDGNDFLYDFGSSADANRLVLAGIDPGDVTVTRSTSDLDDLTLSFAGGGSVSLSEHFYSSTYGVEYIDFADGTSWDRAYLLDAVQ